MLIHEIDLKGHGNSIQFGFEQIPTEEDPDQPLELYGLIYEVDVNDDSDERVSI
jgi:hypothetical protein